MNSELAGKIERTVALVLATIIALPGLVVAASTDKDSSQQMTASGKANSVPQGYVPPLVSNGSLSMLVDYQGGQSQRAYSRMTPGIWWAGRRYGPPNDQLIPFGHFESELSVDGTRCAAPAAWTQTLDTKTAVVTCRNDYDNGLSVETTVFTPLAHDLVVVKKRFVARNASVRSVRATFKYQFTPPGNENRVPRRVTGAYAWSDASRSAEFRYQADGHRPCDGVISVFSDEPVTAAINKQAVALTSDITLDAAKPVEVTTCLLFADSLDGKDYLERAAKLRELVRQEGYDGLHAAHRKAWAAYWGESYVRVPDERLEKAYCTAQYHLRANATKWSFPVGIFNTHWAGRFFGWDEMFCYQALVSSNHRDISRRCPEFRFAGLQKALDRASHYGKPGTYGARYPWEAMEDGSEAAPPGFWMEHVFHMSNIALSAWFQHLYADDAAYLKNTGYPVIKECARFFLANMIYEAPDGGMFIGKCTDLERLGPARQNPFMTSCGAIYTLEAAAQAATLLKTDDGEAATWKHAAAKLRESLPHNGERYVPYAGCREESVASLGGLFPYPLFDETDTRQRNAVYHFVANGRASGNMYPVGNSVCAWYAGWMAAALAMLGDKTEPFKLLNEAAAGAGCFAEMFEINEAKVAMHPWFSTASGNVVYALNQMLVQSRGDQIRIAPAVPEAWKDFSFKLACHGNLAVEVVVKGGRLTKLMLLPNDAIATHRRTLVLPSSLVGKGSLNSPAVKATTGKGSNSLINVEFKGPTNLIGDTK
ncbi:MAG: glycosyl hydrolase family 65 protein [Verrucomicrobiia bacterium]